MELIVIVPTGIMCRKLVAKVSLPGSAGNFTVLNGHAPIVSSLTRGKIEFLADSEVESIDIETGIVEVKENKIWAFIERI